MATRTGWDVTLTVRALRFIVPGYPGEVYVVRLGDWRKAPRNLGGSADPNNPACAAREVVCCPVDVDRGDRHYYLVYVGDCFDPPLAVVNADCPGDAEEAFAAELDWADIDPADMEGYVDEEGEEMDTVNVSQRGTYYDSEKVMMRELVLVSVEIAP